MAATPAQASLETSLTRLNDDGRALLFTEARTATTFSDRPVTGEQLPEIYELMNGG
jgi:3-hydroxypropanoate dehydrogenase